MNKRYILLFVCILFIFNDKSSAQIFYADWNVKFDSISRMMRDLENKIPGLNEKVTNSVTGVSLDEFLRAIAISSGVNISIDPKLNHKVINNFNETKVSDLLLFLCNQYKFDITTIGNIIVLRQIDVPAVQNKCLVNYDSVNKLLSLDVQDVELDIVTQKIVKATGQNIIPTNGLYSQKVKTFVVNMSVPNALEKVAYANSLLLKRAEDGTFIFDKLPVEKADANPQKPIQASVNKNDKQQPTKLEVKMLGSGRMSVSAETAPISEVLNEVSSQSNNNYVMSSIPKGEVTLQLNDATYQEVLKAVLVGTDHIFKKQENIFIIGNKSSPELMSQVLVQLQYRAVDSVLQVLPKDLAGDIDAKVFREQNSIMLSGPSDKVNETEKFIHGLDRLVPVVSIEVMIIDYNSSNTISSGISAGITDDPSPSSGSIFPSIDLNLSSQSINDLINRFNGFGWAKIGRVTPNFYTHLRALENQGVLNIRSTPILSTLNGHQTRMSIGNTEYYLEEQFNIIGTQNPQSTKIQTYKPVDAELSVIITPIVSGDEQITLEIEVNQSDFTERISNTAPPGTVNRTFKSQIRVRNEEMILLGGLEENRKSQTSNGIPLLSKIPILKWIFSSMNKENSKSKLNIFIKPTIIS